MSKANSNTERWSICGHQQSRSRKHYCHNVTQVLFLSMCFVVFFSIFAIKCIKSDPEPLFPRRGCCCSWSLEGALLASSRCLPVQNSCQKGESWHVLDVWFSTGEFCLGFVEFRCATNPKQAWQNQWRSHNAKTINSDSGLILIIFSWNSFSSIWKRTKHLARALAFATFQRSAVSLPPLRVLPSIPMDDFIDLFAATILNRDFSGLAAGWLLFFKFIIDFSVRHISGLSAGWLLFFKLNIDLFFINFHFAGLAAGWLLPCCDKDAQIVPGEVHLHRIQPYWPFCRVAPVLVWEGRTVFGRQVGKIRLHQLLSQPPDRSFDLLSPPRPKCKSHNSFFLPIVSLALPKCMGYRCPLPLFVPLTPRVGCLLRLFGYLFLFSANSWFLSFGWFFLFYFRTLFFFQLVNSIGSIRTKCPTNWRHCCWRDPQCLCKSKIKSKSPESLKSKLYRPHFPISTVSIFQAPPIPFSRLHRLHFLSSTGSMAPIFQAPPSAFSRPQFQEILLTLPQGIYCLQETKSTHSDVLKLSHVHLYLSGIPSLEFQNCNPILNTRPHPLALFTIYAPSTVQDQRLDLQRKHQFWEHLRNIFNHYKSDFIPVLMGDFNTRLYHSTTIKYQDWNPTSAQPFSPPPLMTTYSPPLICHSWLAFYKTLNFPLSPLWDPVLPPQIITYHLRSLT